MVRLKQYFGYQTNNLLVLFVCIARDSHEAIGQDSNQDGPELVSKRTEMTWAYATEWLKGKGCQEFGAEGDLHDKEVTNT